MKPINIRRKPKCYQLLKKTGLYGLPHLPFMISQKLKPPINERCVILTTSYFHQKPKHKLINDPRLTEPNHKYLDRDFKNNFKLLKYTEYLWGISTGCLLEF